MDESTAYEVSDTASKSGVVSADAPACPSVVVFDLDGTLVDTMPLLADLATDVLAARYAMPRDGARAAYLATSGMPFHRQLAVIHPRDERNAGAAAEFEARKVALVTQVRPDAPTLDALRGLRDAGLRLAVSSNTTQALVDRFVAGCDVPFDVALGWRPGLEKGSAHFAEICRQLKCACGDLLFVGDSLFDARAAEESRVAFVAKVGTFSAEEFLHRWPGVSCAMAVCDVMQEVRRRRAGE